MVGIDVVDLHDPLFKKRSLDQLRFISNPADSVLDLEDPALHFWVFWSAKEAIFKCQRQDTRFDPKSIPVSFQFQKSDRWTFNSGEISGYVQTCPSHILAICFLGENQPVYHVQKRRTTNAFLEVRTNIKTHWLKHEHKRITIGAHHKMPIIEETGDPVSFSHHGRFVAFAYLNQGNPLSHKNGQ